VQFDASASQSNSTLNLTAASGDVLAAGDAGEYPVSISKSKLVTIQTCTTLTPVDGSTCDLVVEEVGLDHPYSCFTHFDDKYTSVSDFGALADPLCFKFGSFSFVNGMSS
jgi:hypothetical protein